MSSIYSVKIKNKHGDNNVEGEEGLPTSILYQRPLPGMSDDAINDDACLCYFLFAYYTVVGKRNLTHLFKYP